MFIPFSTFLTSSFFSFSHSRWNHLSTERTDQVLRKGQGKRMSPQNQGLVNTIGTTTSGLCPKSETWMNLVGFVLKGVMLPSWDPKISLISMKWSGTLLSEEEVTLGQYQSSSQTTPTTTSENPSTNGSKRREMVSWKSSPRREPTSSTASTLAVWSMRQTIASKPVIGSTAMRTRWASHWTGSYDTMWGKPQNHKACFVTMLAGYPLRTYSSVSQSGDMNTNVGRMSSSPPKGEQTIEMHGTWKRRATAWRCCSRSCSTVPDMDVVYVNKSWRSGSTRTLIAAAWHALTTTSTRTRLFPTRGYCSIQLQFALQQGTRRDPPETTSCWCPPCSRIRLRPIPSCQCRFASTSRRRPTFEAFGGKDWFLEVLGKVIVCSRSSIHTCRGIIAHGLSRRALTHEKGTTSASTSRPRPWWWSTVVDWRVRDRSLRQRSSRSQRSEEDGFKIQRIKTTRHGTGCSFRRATTR